MRIISDTKPEDAKPLSQPLGGKPNNMREMIRAHVTLWQHASKAAKKQSKARSKRRREQHAIFKLNME